MGISTNNTITIIKDGPYVLLGDIFNSCDLTSIRDFFQFITADGEMSPLSIRLNNRTDEEKDELWERLLLIAGVDESAFLFNPILNNILKDIDVIELSDKNMVIDRVKGFVQHGSSNKKTKKTHKIDALFKRIRDALAHGRIYKYSNFVVFEDKVNQMTGRIILSMEILEKWKNYIQQQYSCWQEY